MIAPLQRKTILFAGGGTGGHLFPGIAVARALPSIQAVFYVPDDRGDEERLKGEFPCLPARCPRADRQPLLFPARLAAATRRARATLKRLDAAAVVGLGGYASLPAALAARTLGLPLYLLELNAVPGRATRLLSRFACGIGLASPGAHARLRSPAARVTGPPLRDELRVRADPRDFGLVPDRPTLLVMGGSQGARGLNDRVLEGLPACADLEFQVLHCAGSCDAARVREAYSQLEIEAAVVDFLPDIGRAYAASDLVLSRAGASTVAECLALARAAVFVPYPRHKDRQQAHNAWEAVRAGAARIVEESDLDPAALRELVSDILLDGSARASMEAAAAALASPEGAKAVAAHLVESVGPALAHPALLAELGG